MDLGFLFKLENDSGQIGSAFLREEPGIGIPYLVVICLATVSGIIGNALVIAAVFTNRVRM